MINESEKVEHLEAKVRLLESHVNALKQENMKLRAELNLNSPDSFPKTYQGAIAFLNAVSLVAYIRSDEKRLANILNETGFPAYKNGKWDEQKVKRQIKKIRESNPRRYIDVDVTPCPDDPNDFIDIPNFQPTNPTQLSFI